MPSFSRFLLIVGQKTFTRESAGGFLKGSLVVGQYHGVDFVGKFG